MKDSVDAAASRLKPGHAQVLKESVELNFVDFTMLV
jgi:hypothetical protein